MLDRERIVQVVSEATGRPTTRRGFLSRSAKLAAGGGVAVALAGAPTAAFARHGRGGVGTPGNTGDIDVLNYALTLENFEAAFYVEAVNTFSEAEIEDALASRGIGQSLSSTGYQRIVEVRDHEVTHVQTLRQVIQSLGGNPVPPCEYDFSGGLTDVPTFIATAALLEDTGVMAYDGAIALIESRRLQTAAATIATVEARHASYFRTLNLVSPFPAAFDTAKTPQETINAVLATGFIISCPVAPPIPDQPRGCKP